MTEQALAAHDAALATADEQRRASEDARLAELAGALEDAAIEYDRSAPCTPMETRRFRELGNARAALLAYIETIRK